MKPVIFSIILTLLASVTAHADGSRQKATPMIPERWQAIYESYGFAPALKVGDTIYISGIIVRLSEGESFEEQYANGIRRTFKQVEEILALEGATLDDIVDMTSFHTNLPQQLETILRVRKELMNLPHPAWTAVGTTALAAPDGQTEIKFTVKLTKPN
jgi:enamine deaminase RidA (YjgF/YER057c/UK114 family)